MLNDLDLSGIQDERAREVIVRLLNLVEEQGRELAEARAEIQRLRDENNRLKGEQGKPTIKAKRRDPQARQDYSSEQERRQPKKREGRSKIERLTVTREEIATVDRALLPVDAEFKGYEAVVVQDLRLERETIRFHKEKYYSHTTGQSYLAALPVGYEGQFGPGLRALVLVWYYGSQMSEPKIVDLLHEVGIAISAGQVSNLLIKDQDDFHAEQDAAYAAGLRSSPWQHTDDTGTRVNGENHHCHTVCNPLHTTYFTAPSKDRLSVLDALSNGRPRLFRLNDEAFDLLAGLGVSGLTRQCLREKFPVDQSLSDATLNALLTLHLPHLGSQTRKRIFDGLAIAAYHAQDEWPVVQLLLCDDAPQFGLLTDELALCWIHEGRHYTKLTPLVAAHRQLLADFRTKFWAFYDRLLAYRDHPSSEERDHLSADFDTLFSTTTGYWALDDRIATTRSHKAALLKVLEHPELPLHNNPAELAARARVRKRDVSFGPRTRDGTKAWDTFMSLAATTKKLGLSFFQFIHDRITRAYRIPPLAELIDQRAKALNLGASWAAG